MWSRPLICGCLFVCVVTALSGCDRQQSQLTATQPSQSEAPPLGGAELYATHCAGCHEMAVPKAANLQMMSFMAPSVIYRALTEGVMTPMAAQLTDDQKLAIARHVTGRDIDTVSQQAAPLLCEGDLAEFDVAATPRAVGWGFEPGNSRFISAEDASINRDNLGRLELRWVFGFPDAVRARSHPAVAGGAVYVGSQDGTVYALERETGCIRWQYAARAEVRTGMVITPWDAAQPDAKPTVYFGDFLGNVYALDAITGKPVWTQRPDEHPNATITAAPTLYDGVLYVSVSSLEVAVAARPSYECCTFRGSVTAYDAATGALLWKTYTIEEPPRERGLNTAGATRYAPSGAPVWNTPAIDTARSQLYIGTGENYSSPTTGTSDSIIAMDLKTGAVKWVFQATAGDAWNIACELDDRANCPDEDGPDVDFGAATILATDSNGRDYVLAGQKSGDVWALNPDSGEVIWTRKLGRGGLVGGVHFGMALAGDRLFVPINDSEVGINTLSGEQATSSKWPGEPRPGLYALDIRSGEVLWSWNAEDICDGREFCKAGNAPAITATPDLVLAGSLDGYLRIHDATSGEVLWRFNTAQKFTTVSGQSALGGAMAGGAGPLLHDGFLYVNSGYLFNQDMPGNVLLAFSVRESRRTLSPE
jgi:polyvinyl alcohol dehydrogenase (cytochrome)